MAKANEEAGVSKIRRFTEGVKTEFGKIIWPEKDTVIKQLVAVLAVSIVTGLLIVLVDFGAQKLVDLLLSL